MADYIGTEGMKLEVIHNYRVANSLSMGIGGMVSHYATAYSEEDVQNLYRFSIDEGLPFFVLGGGSNLVVSDAHVTCLMVAIALKGLEEVQRDADHVYLKVAAGEDWDGFVKYTIDNGYWGCENLSLIPGLVGATPVQNVGAFGQEVKDIIQSVRCYDRLKDCFIDIENIGCEFKFRSSIFNSRSKDRFVICSVSFKLGLIPSPCLKRQEFSNLRSIDKYTSTLQSDIRERVVSYRTNGKNLPVGAKFGSSGTFFRTGVIKGNAAFVKVLLRTLTQLGPKAAALIVLFALKYRSPDGYKLPSKLLIQLCGLSDLKVGALFLLASNPACVVSRLNDTPLSDDLVRIIDTVVHKVYQNTGVVVPIEPEMLGFGSEIQFEVSEKG